MRFNLKKIIIAAAVGFLVFAPLAQAAPGDGCPAGFNKNPDGSCSVPGGTAIVDSPAGCSSRGGTWTAAGLFTSGYCSITPSKSAGTSDFGCNLFTAAGSAVGAATTLTDGEGLARCLTALTYYIGPGIAQYPAYIGAYFFSIVVQLSLNSAAYALDFLSSGWTIVRDVANMAFIFILIYLAITIMLQAETSGTIKTLAAVVVVALLVNFSFFFTRIVIDAGNILAVQFYNAIQVGNAAPIGGAKDLSAPIMNALNLQGLSGDRLFNDARAASGGSVMGGLIVTTVIYLSAAAMFWMLFFTFLTVGIKFMLRIVGLWFILISSPLAFVSKAVPGFSTYFKHWTDYLIKFSFYPAIFLFLFFILTQFLTGILTSNNGSVLNGIFNAAGTAAAGGTTNGGYLAVGTAIAAVAIRMGFIIAVLYVALKASDWVVKEGSSIANSVTGWSTGKAFGVVGWAGRSTLGWAGQAAGRSASLRSAAANNVFARTLWRGASGLGRRSFDVRAAPGVRTGFTKMGADIGTATGTGGYQATFDRKVAQRQADAGALAPTARDLEKAQRNAIRRLNEEDPNFGQNLANAHDAFNRTRQEQQELGGAATADDHRRFREARQNFNAMAQRVNALARTSAGTGNARAYAESISHLGAHNLGGFPSLTAALGFVPPADLEAAARIRGGQNDHERLGYTLQALNLHPTPAPAPAPAPAPPPGPAPGAAPLTRAALDKVREQSGSLTKATERLERALDKTASSIEKARTTESDSARKALKAMRGLSEKTSEGFSSIGEALRKENGPEKPKTNEEKHDNTI